MNDIAHERTCTPPPTAAGSKSAATLRIRRGADLPAGSKPKPVQAEQISWIPKRLDTKLFPDQPSGGGGPPATIPNIQHLLSGNGISARYNVIKKKVEIAIPGLAGVIDNADSVTIAHVKSLLALHGMYSGDIRGAIEAIANQHPYNPVQEWIERRPWDGISRLDQFYQTLVADDEYPASLKATILFKWLLSAVAAAFMPSGFSTRLVLTLQGPQSIGKTRWGLSLIDDPVLRASVIKTDHHFDGGNKDHLITAVRYWITELGELESSFRKDQERLKGILTRDTDVVRLPYAAAESEFPRRTVFYATVNGYDFLSDPTGSTRWGVIRSWLSTTSTGSTCSSSLLRSPPTSSIRNSGGLPLRKSSNSKAGTVGIRQRVWSGTACWR